MLDPRCCLRQLRLVSDRRAFRLTRRQQEWLPHLLGGIIGLGRLIVVRLGQAGTHGQVRGRRLCLTPPPRWSLLCKWQGSCVSCEGQPLKPDRLLYRRVRLATLDPHPSRPEPPCG